MRTVEIVKMNKGYYVTRLWNGRNMGSQFFKTKTKYEPWVKEWTKGRK